MNQERYRIEQNFTDGWGVVDERMDVTLTKEQCRIRYEQYLACLLYTSPSPRDATLSRMPSSA